MILIPYSMCCDEEPENEDLLKGRPRPARQTKAWRHALHGLPRRSPPTTCQTHI